MISIPQFQQTIFDYYHQHKRPFPWRETTDVYLILVSELMLQQTQTQRVLPKYEAFVKRFPNAKMLADSNLSEVLTYWQGLGYNRRAMYLHEAAKQIESNPKLIQSDSIENLQQLKGVGPYTSRAIATFAFNQPHVFIETNIRSVYLHFFFKDQTGVTDKQILEQVELTLDRKNPREWYYALMDYGVYLKQTIGNPNTRSKHYTKQSKFEGSNRQIRGLILKTLVAEKKLSGKKLAKSIDREYQKVETNLDKMIQEGLLVKDKKGMYSIA